jgi:hypothetical protein
LEVLQVGEFHIFTSGKSGIGKTLFALSLTVFHMKRNQKIILFDFDFISPNLTYLLPPIICQSSQKKLTLSVDQFQISILEINASTYLVYPDQFYHLPASINDIYKYIAITYNHLKITNNFTPDAIIVDTNLNLPNFGVVNPEELKQIKANFSPIVEIYTPFYWHLWALADFIHLQLFPLKKDFPYRSFVSVALDSIGLIWGNKFDETRNLINVFNVYALYPHPRIVRPPKDILSFEDAKLAGSHIKELLLFDKRRFSPRGISLNELQQLKTKYNKALSKDHFKFSDQGKEMYEALGEAIQEIMKEQFEGEIPRNLLAIGTYYLKLVGFTDLWAPKINSYKELEIHLYPLTRILDDYINLILTEIEKTANSY